MKKTIFSFIATIFLSVVSLNAQDTDDLQPIDFGFGKVSPTYGDCMKGPSFCSSRSTEPISIEGSFTAFSKINDETLLLVISDKFFQDNRENLTDGLIIGQETTVQSDLARSLGYDDYFTVAVNNYPLKKKDNFYEVYLKRSRK